MVLKDLRLRIEKNLKELMTDETITVQAGIVKLMHIYD